MKINKLPFKIGVQDYHEFEDVQYYFNKIIRGIKVEEIGLDYATGEYLGIVYHKTTSKPAIKALTAKIIKEYELLK